MKKFVQISIIAAAAIVAAACSKEIGTENPAGTNVVVFTATLEQPTKADLTQYDVIWSVGDKIAVSNGTVWAESAELTATDITDGGRSASFSVAIDPASSYTAVYPASAKSAATLPDGAAADAIMLTLPSAQVIPAGKKVDPNALVQIATTDDPSKVSFKNATSLLEITIPEDGIEAVTFEFLNAEESRFKISGNAPVVPTPAVTTGDASSVTISGSFVAGENYYATVFPQTGVKSVNLICAKSGTDCKALARRTGTGAAEFDLPVNGGWKVRNFGTLSWFDGTIGSKADLDRWAILSRYYGTTDVIKLTADINYDGGTWTPVKANGNKDQFAGVLDGQGHSIYNIIINPTEEYSGFFSTLASESPMERVCNISFGLNPATGEYDGVSTLTASSATVKRLGIVAGYISNCDVVRVTNYIPIKDVTTANDVMFGAIAGRTGGTMSIIGCNNYGTMECASTTQTSHYIGVFDGENCVIDKCVNYGTVKKTKSASGKGNSFLGGIVSRTASGAIGLKIRGCVNNGQVANTGNVQPKQIYVGGILGMDNKSGDTSIPNVTIQGCTNETGAVIESNSLSKATNGAAFGGIIGKADYYSVISDCANYGSILKSNNHNGLTSKFGGIAGMVSNASVLIENCTNGSEYNDAWGSVTSTIETKSDSSTEYYGGIAGGFDAGVIRGCSNYGTISTVSTEIGIVEIAGGIVGQTSGGTLENCECKGKVSVAAPHSTCGAGGIIGFLEASAAYATGAGCKVSGNFSCGNTGNTGLVIGMSDSSASTSFGTSESPVTVGASQFNGTSVDSSNYSGYLAGSTAGGTTIHAIFQ
jgi:hypothetical protein